MTLTSSFFNILEKYIYKKRLAKRPLLGMLSQPLFVDRIYAKATYSISFPEQKRSELFRLELASDLVPHTYALSRASTLTLYCLHYIAVICRCQAILRIFYGNKTIHAILRLECCVPCLRCIAFIKIIHCCMKSLNFGL